jgi:hypothetical protein
MKTVCSTHASMDPTSAAKMHRRCCRGNRSGGTSDTGSRWSPNCPSNSQVCRVGEALTEQSISRKSRCAVFQNLHALNCIEREIRDIHERALAVVADGVRRHAMTIDQNQRGPDGQTTQGDT